MHISQATLLSSEYCPLEGIFIENKTNPWISVFQIKERSQIFLGNQFCQLLTCLVPSFSLNSCLIYKNTESLSPLPSSFHWPTFHPLNMQSPKFPLNFFPSQCFIASFPHSPQWTPSHTKSQLSYLQPFLSYHQHFIILPIFWWKHSPSCSKSYPFVIFLAPLWIRSSLSPLPVLPLQ